MLKLMKYEFRKQMVSKIIMVAVLIAMIALFMLATFKGNADLVAVAFVFMLMALMISVAYAAIEITIVFEKDLTTKQSYMLFMVPQSAAKILGAKLISAIVQVMAIFAAYGIAITFCLSVYTIYKNGFEGFTQNVKALWEKLMQPDLNGMPILNLLAGVLVFWFFFIMLSLFVTTLMNTVMKNGKISSFLSGVIYLLGTILVVTIIVEINNIPLEVMVYRVMVYALMITLNVALFVGTAWLMDKKLSV